MQWLRNDGELILQADHLTTRANSATYADTRLIVCVCKEGPWLEEMARLPPDRLALWERCERDSWRLVRTGAYDWKIAIVAVK